MVIGLVINLNPAYAIRCGNDLIQEGDSTFEVILTLKKCGNVMEKEMVQSENTYEKIEKWLIRAYEMGHHYCYELTFKDTKLIEIRLLGQCD